MYRLRWSIPLLLLLQLVARPASAQGINLRWGSCPADGGVRNTAFACNNNLGQRGFTCSFLLPDTVSARSVSGVIDVVAAGFTLPDWWNYRVCRSGSIAINSSAAGAVVCNDFMGSCSSDGDFTAILPGVPAANAERLEFTRLKCPTGSPASLLSPGVEYLGPVMTINFNRTVSVPGSQTACAGCGTPVCLILTQLHVGPSAGGVTLTNPAIAPDGNVITWQGASLGPGGVCLGATPTKRTLWGEVKALYR
jgi:subtilisin family serine protease